MTFLRNNWSVGANFAFIGKPNVFSFDYPPLTLCAVDVELSFYAVIPYRGTNELIFGHFLVDFAIENTFIKYTFFEIKIMSQQF